MKRVKERKDGVVAKSNQGVEKWLKNTENCTVYEGQGCFEDSHSVRVGEAVLEAEKIFINAGGRAFVPPFSGIQGVDYLTNSSMMEVDFLPEHLVIIGGSYIGLEFGQMYRCFGSEVTIVERASRLILHEDEDISEAVQEILEKEGIHIRLEAECIDAERDGDQVRVNLDCERGAREVTGSHLLLAVGRVPNTGDLGLEKAGIEMNERGYIEVDDQLRTNVPGVWALGDCNGKGSFTHTSYNDYEIVAANLLDDDPRRVSRAVEKSETQGFMKILVDAESKEILGAAILGIGGDEIIHSILDVMYAKAPYTVIQRAVHIHPTVTELIPTMLGDLKPLE